MLTRHAQAQLLAQTHKHFISILVGPRQVGKTVLMHMLEAASTLPTTFLDVENSRDAVVLRDGITSLLAEIGSGRQLLFLDEFHRIPNALQLFKELHDHHPQIKVFASGSSSIEIHRHLTQSAVGRVRRTRIFPLSFSEWGQDHLGLDLDGWDLTRPLPPRRLQHINQMLQTFLVWGGMPELVSIESDDERREALYEIVALYLEKDIRSLLDEQDLIRFNALLELVALQSGQLINRSSLSQKLGMSYRQVEKQLSILEHTFVFRPIRSDYANQTKRLVKAPKGYWYDNGIRNVLVKDFRPPGARPDGGALIETHVFNELEKAARVGMKVHFHRTQDGQEIDFILERDRQKLLIEVKAELSSSRIPSAIRDQLQREDVLGAVVFSQTHQDATTHQGKPVLFWPLCLAHRAVDLWQLWAEDAQVAPPGSDESRDDIESEGTDKENPQMERPGSNEPPPATNSPQDSMV